MKFEKINQKLKRVGADDPVRPFPNKGITLVALVVTIIILIILAGVTLNIALDQNGIIGKAEQGTADYKNASEQEKDIIGQIEYYITDGNVPIPSGYVKSEIAGETNVATGLVIYEIPEADRNKANLWTEIDEADGMLTVQKNYNQYVWIPVTNINDMVMCESNSANSVCNLALDGETLKCTVHTSTATKLCGRLYTGKETITGSLQNRPVIVSISTDFNKRDQTYGTYPKEPVLITDYDNDSNSSYMEKAGISDKKASSLLSQMQSDFTKMATSAAKNGGFYISRYEIGAEGASKKKQTVLDNVTGNMWYGLYKASRNEAKKMHMIFGSQYDQAIKFIGRETEVGHTDRELTKSPVSSGLNEKDKMKNIYDLEGNYYEWTQEANSTSFRVGRGCAYTFNSMKLFSPAVGHNDNIPDMTNIAGYSSRSTLYL